MLSGLLLSLLTEDREIKCGLGAVRTGEEENHQTRFRFFIDERADLAVVN